MGIVAATCCMQILLFLCAFKHTKADKKLETRRLGGSLKHVLNQFT